jgi:hypothetical protein
MKLHKIMAGGPGSGRHAENGVAKVTPKWSNPNEYDAEKHAATSAKLVSMGFAISSKNKDPKDFGGVHYSKVSRPPSGADTHGLIQGADTDPGTQHHVVVHPNGSFAHYSQGAHGGHSAKDLDSVYLGASMFKANDQVIVKEQQLHGRCSEIKAGRVVSATGERVTVAFMNNLGSSTKEYPVDRVSLAEASFGLGMNTDNPYEKPVQRYVPRR